MFVLNANAMPVNAGAILHLLVHSGLRWKMPLAQLEMLERNAINEKFTIISEVTTVTEGVEELMKFKGKHTLMGLPIIVYHDAANFGYIDLCLDDDVIARIECLAVPFGS